MCNGHCIVILLIRLELNNKDLKNYFHTICVLMNTGNSCGEYSTVFLEQLQNKEVYYIYCSLSGLM